MSRFEWYSLAACCAAVAIVISAAAILEDTGQAKRDAARAQEMILQQAAELDALEAKVELLKDINARLEVVLIDGTPYGAALQ